MSGNPIQDFLSTIRIPFLGENLMRKYENEKSPLRAELFTIAQLEQYALTLANTHVLSQGDMPEILIKRLNDNEEILLEVRNLLVESARENSPLSPAGEWLLDNYYLIEDHIQTGKKHFPKKYSETLPKLAKGPLAGFPRVYSIAFEIISHTDGRVDLETLQAFVQSYQKAAPLNLGELWAIPIMLRLALIENLRRLAAQLAIERINKNLAGTWAERIAEVAEKDPKSLIVITADMARSDPPITSSFVAEMTRRLLGKGNALSLPLTWIEQRLAESGLTTNGLVQQESQSLAASQVSVSNSIGSLRFLNHTDWRDFVEQASIVESILRLDPSGVYPRMDFHTRDYYRHKIESLAKLSGQPESKTARVVIDLAIKNTDAPDSDNRQSHVGYYLIDKGLAETEHVLQIRHTRTERLRRTCAKTAVGWYVTSILVLTGLFSSTLVLHAYREGLHPILIVVAGLLSIVATSHLATALVNWISTILVGPDFLPRMDYAEGIPAESRTIVVVPTLFSNTAELDDLIETMEVRFLSNRQPNLHYALLTDFKDSTVEITEDEKLLLLHARQRIEALQQKYRQESDDIFFLLHRPRRWNGQDKVWMGYERKRGKLGDLNALLRGQGDDRFMVIAGNTDVLHQIQYVITLDTDTQLPREAAWKIIATLAHPLNKPHYDAQKRRVTRGYGILQPRLATALTHGRSSWYAKIHAIDQGIDPYTRSVSDVYQDIAREGSFIGKGIYEVDAFESALGDRFPENRVLSHDLLEGCHARSGLINDVELYEEYPLGYLADMKRRHRWIRGDWQIARWIWGNVPGPDRKKHPNVITTLSKWKIADNLRRSLVAPALLGILLFGWFATASPWYWSLSVIGILLPPPILLLLFNLSNKPREVERASHIRTSIDACINQLLQLAWSFISLPYEAIMNLDAIGRTIWRIYFSKKHLLQWNPGHQTTAGHSLRSHILAMWSAPLIAMLVLIALTYTAPLSLLIATPLALLWIASPALAWWISLPQLSQPATLSATQLTYLRKLARKTWAYFEQFVGPEHHWLPPDNFQEYPSPRVANRTSPTNIGLALLSTLSAYDFGYLTLGKLLMRCGNMMDTLTKLDRYKGHLYNWYETTSLTPLFPRYVSTVDSGNLAGSLLTLKEGLEEIKSRPLIHIKTTDGLIDSLRALREHIQSPNPQKQVRDLQHRIGQLHTLSMHTLRDLIQHTIRDIRDLKVTLEESSEITNWWLDHILYQCADVLDELDILFIGFDTADLPAEAMEILAEIHDNPDLTELLNLCREFHLRLETRLSGTSDEDETEVINTWLGYTRTSIERLQERMNMVDTMKELCIDLATYEYDFLFDKTRHYLAIGYNIEDHRRDAGHYDLLGSEARLGVYVAICQGKIPQESWFALGRQLTQAGSDPALISWSGSMFEYLMPMLLLPTYDNTLLDQTQKGAVRRQMEYGEKRNLPWGISESCFNMFHANMDYQYRAFGVPGLGLKRGLGDDYVVSPYASVLALMVDPGNSIDNLRRLVEEGLEGHWGMYEAIDYTPARLQRGQQATVVKAFMTHHQGMSLVAIANVLDHQLMQRRFQSDVQLKTSLLLLQEKIPQVSTFYTPVMDVGDIPSDSMLAELRIIRTTQTPVPEVQLLSNGRYHVMVSNSGGGYSRWKDIAVTRWREDGTKDDWGTYCFFRDLESGKVWSNAFQPTRQKPDHYEVIFSQGRAEFRSHLENIETHTEIVVSPEDDIELRRVHIANRSRKKRWIAVTSYAEVVLNQGIAEMLHPAFSNLFVQSDIIGDKHAILCTRRPRSVDEHPPSMFHIMKVHGGEDHLISYETNRDAFIGRGNTIHQPDAVYEEQLANHEGSILDPVVAIQYRIRLRPYETVTVDMLYGMAETSEYCHELIAKYQDKHMADRALELAWTHIQVILRQINASAADASLFCKMAGSIIYNNPAMRADPSIILRNQRGQSGLWSHSISGDWPIVILQIEDNTHIDMVQKLVQAHAFWRLKGLTVDLVIWNEDHGGYRQLLHNQIQSLITPILSIEEQHKPGGIFVRSAEQLSNEDRVLFQTVARMIISDKLGTLEEQLNRRKRIRQTIAQLPITRFNLYPETGITPPAGLLHHNGIGGFAPDGKEYVITTAPGVVTPAPWSNVIANPNFGTVLTESGASYTWFQNAHELRLTPWHNDPVTDASGEHYYIRDDETGRFWSPSPLPARGKTPYITRHGFGYSVFEHLEDGIQSTMTVYVDPDKPVKYCVLRLQNQTDRDRILSAWGYIEWVLGDLRHKTHMHIISELDLQHGSIVVRNSYQTEFGTMVAFFDVNETTRTISADRSEFIGRNGTYATPDAMQKAKLSGRVGAGLDPCAAIQVQLSLPAGEEHELVFRMGTGSHMNDMAHLIRETRSTAREALQEVKRRWQQVLSAVVVECPDPAISLLANGWLTYQTLSCRMWARSGFYQSGGAFGFRDQLQDVLSLMHSQPALAKTQLLLSASRQFVKGDVQHWWHPPVGRGVRTKCSDDYLWLPYVLAKYVTVTGDETILNEDIWFLDGRELTPEEHSVYDLPARSDQHAPMYEHAARALEFGLQFGPHGLPLMGAGDWNDGMDRVGTEGKGESIWLGWFFYETIQRFIPLMELKKDTLRKERFTQTLVALRESLDKHGWDGEWYKRAYFDDGTPLGSHVNDECRIDSIAQSWSVISGAGDPEKARQAMANAAEKLVNEDKKVIQLFDPPFDKSALNPGYIKGYVPGVRENGGQYTHAAIWMIMAFAILKDRERMWQLLQLVNPVNHGRTEEDMLEYKVEPYVIAADVYAVEGQVGRGGWTWYTGSAGWMYQLIMEYVFGLRRHKDTLTLDPCLPPHWDQVTVHYQFGTSVYHIMISQEMNHADVTEVIVDGALRDDGFIALVDDGNEHEVLVRSSVLQKI